MPHARWPRESGLRESRVLQSDRPPCSYVEAQGKVGSRVPEAWTRPECRPSWLAPFGFAGLGERRAAEGALFISSPDGHLAGFTPSGIVPGRPVGQDKFTHRACEMFWN